MTRRPTGEISAALARDIERKLGLRLGGSRWAASRGAVERARAEAGASDDEAYRLLLEREPRVFDALAAALTIGETYLFRERVHLDLLRHHIVPEVLARRGRSHSVKLWSAGCSTGEEAYSLAMVLDQTGVPGRVLGTDLSRAALERAETGVYGKWSLRGISGGELDPYLELVGGRFRVRDIVTRRVDFAYHNLVEGPPGRSRFDVVFCRNVLIYLTAEAVDQAAKTLVAALAPDGWLVTSSSDPPLSGDDLDRVRTPCGIAYRRTAPHRLRPPAADVPAPALHPVPGPAQVAVPCWRPTAPLLNNDEIATAPDEETLAEAEHALRIGDHARAAILASAAVAAGVPGAHAILIRSTANEGRTGDALEAAQAGLDTDPLNAELHYLRAVLHLGEGDPAQAVAAADVVLYLRPDLAVAHLVRAEATRLLGDGDAWERGARNARRLLAALATDAPVPLGEGETAGRLLAAVEGQSRSAAALR